MDGLRQRNNDTSPTERARDNVAINTENTHNVPKLNLQHHNNNNNFSTKKHRSKSGEIVIVVGGDGFCGWPTCLRLTKLGYEVHIVDSLWRRDIDKELKTISVTPIAPIEERIKAWEEISGHKMPFYKFDVAEDEGMDKMLELFKKLKPKAVVHFGEQRSAPYSMKSSAHRIKTVSNNVGSTLNILTAITQSQQDIHLVHLGTMGVYGYGDQSGKSKIPEGYLELINPESGEKERISAPYKPGSMYHMTKCLDNVLFQFHAKNDHLRITDLHQGIVWGVHTEETGMDERLYGRLDQDGDFKTVLNGFCIQAACGRPVTPYGTGGQTRAFIHITDTVNCISAALENPPLSKTEGKNGGQPTEVSVFNQMMQTLTVMDLAQQISRLTGVEVKCIDNPRNEAAANHLNVTNDRFKELGAVKVEVNDEKLLEVINEIKRFRHRLIPVQMQPKSFWNLTCDAQNTLNSNSQKNIVLYAGDLSYMDGIGVRYLAMLKSLASQGFNVALVTPRPVEDPVVIGMAAQIVVLDSYCPFEGKKRGLWLKHFSTPFSPNNFMKQLKLFREFKPMVCHIAIADTLGSVACFMSLLNNVPTTTAFHTSIQFVLDVCNKCARGSTIANVVTGFSCRVMYKLSAWSSSSLIFSGDLQEFRDMKWSSQQPHAVLGPLVDTDLFRRSQDHEKVLALRKKLTKGNVHKKLLLFVGRVSPEKRCDELVNAVMKANSDAKGSSNDLCIAFIGPKSMIDIDGTIDGIYCDGVCVSREELHLFYTAADVFVTASVGETVGFTYYEAMACGTPVVAARSEAAEVAVSQGKTNVGLLYESGNGKDFIRCVHEVLSGIENKVYVAEEIEATMQHFTAENSAARVVSVYRESRPIQGFAKVLVMLVNLVLGVWTSLWLWLLSLTNYMEFKKALE